MCAIKSDDKQLLLIHNVRVFSVVKYYMYTPGAAHRSIAIDRSIVTRVRVDHDFLSFLEFFQKANNTYYFCKFLFFLDLSWTQKSNE